MAAEPAPRADGRALHGLAARIDRFIGVLGHCTSWLALVIVALMACNVLVRYLLNTGSVWSQELEWHLLAPLILFGMSYALRDGEHVRVDVLYAGFSTRAKLLVDLVSALLCIAISAIIIWLSVKYVHQSWMIGEGSSDPGGLPARWALKALIPIGFAFLILQSVAVALGTLESLKCLQGSHE